MSTDLASELPRRRTRSTTMSTRPSRHRNRTRSVPTRRRTTATAGRGTGSGTPQGEYARAAVVHLPDDLHPLMFDNLFSTYLITIPDKSGSHMDRARIWLDPPADVHHVLELVLRARFVRDEHADVLGAIHISYRVVCLHLPVGFRHHPTVHSSRFPDLIVSKYPPSSTMNHDTLPLSSSLTRISINFPSPFISLSLPQSLFSFVLLRTLPHCTLPTAT